MIEWIGEQDGRAGFPGRGIDGHNGGKVERLTGAQDRQNLLVPINKVALQRKTPGQPVGDGGPEFRRPVNGRIAVPQSVTGFYGFANQGGWRVLGLANGKGQRLYSSRWRDRVKQGAQAIKGIIAQLKNKGVQHGRHTSLDF